MLKESRGWLDVQGVVERMSRGFKRSHYKSVASVANLSLVFAGLITICRYEFRPSPDSHCLSVW